MGAGVGTAVGTGDGARVGRGVGFGVGMPVGTCSAVPNDVSSQEAGTDLHFYVVTVCRSTSFQTAKR